MTLVAQISDTHLSAGKPFFADNFRAACAAIAARGTELMINTGDVTLNGADEESDLTEARRLHDAAGLPFRAVPGNHDIGDTAAVAATAPYHAQPVDTARLARFRRHFGPGHWRHDLPGWRLVGFNSQILGSDMPEEAEQEAFLAEAMATAGDRAVALFGHKPLCDRDTNETVAGGRFLHPAARHRLLEVLGPRRPAVIATGHVHQFRDLVVGASRHVWAPSTGYVMPERVQPLYGMRDVGWVEHRFGADGSHDCAYLRPGKAATLSIADFPQAYGAM
ncbi:metallophosphoesterase family protein [Marinibaculum pumilum]|uniref:Metallophosphoesterase family protein n=1 Tax=Marinibaculum pumilum TaxID=1766165 RepID=A0ABV7L1H6_9PROT